MKAQPYSMEWDAERLLKALNMVIDEQAFSPLRRRTMKKKLGRKLREGTFDPNTLDTEWLYRVCAASLMLHDYHWFAWEWRSQWSEKRATTPFHWPQWDGRKSRLLVLGEQGLGDELVFSTCYHELAKDVEEAYIEVDPRLLPIMKRSMPENLHFVNRFLHPRKMIVPTIADYYNLYKDLGIQAFIPAGNIPKIYRRAVSDFPKRETGHLVADPTLVEKWAACVGQTGWSWKGRQGELPVKAPIGISLQYSTQDHLGLPVPAINLKKDVEDVFAIIANLECVVTTTNAVAHMAGSIGTPCDCIKAPPIFATKDDIFNNRVQPWWPYDSCDWYTSITMYRSFQQWIAQSSCRSARGTTKSASKLFSP